MCTLLSSFRNSVYIYLPFINNSSANVYFWVGTIRPEHSTHRFCKLLELKRVSRVISVVGSKIMFYNASHVTSCCDLMQKINHIERSGNTPKGQLSH
jgi:hypothetical protein